MHTQTLIHATNTISSHAWHRFCPNMLLMQHTIWASTLFSTCLRRAFCLHHADSDANTCNKYNFLAGLGSKRSSHHRFCPNMLLMQHTIWASTLFSTCLRRTFCLHHADSDANTCNKYNFLTGLGSKRSSHHRFCPNMLLMQHTIWASTLFSTCLRRTFCLHHADSDANTCNKYNFLAGLGSRRSSHHRFCSKHAVHATYNLGIYPLQYMPQKNLLSAPCRFRR